VVGADPAQAVGEEVLGGLGAAPSQRPAGSRSAPNFTLVTAASRSRGRWRAGEGLACCDFRVVVLAIAAARPSDASKAIVGSGGAGRTTAFSIRLRAGCGLPIARVLSAVLALICGRLEFSSQLMFVGLLLPHRQAAECRRRRRGTAAVAPTGRRSERSAWRVLGPESDSAVLADRRESGGRQAPVPVAREGRRRTPIRARRDCWLIGNRGRTADATTVLRRRSRAGGWRGAGPCVCCARAGLARGEVRGSSAT
jgi:hypothetical protein